MKTHTKTLCLVSLTILLLASSALAQGIWTTYTAYNTVETAADVNDLRLALGTMLEIGPDGPDRLPPEHPMSGHLDVYHWLTVLQEYLVLGLMGKPIR